MSDLVRSVAFVFRRKGADALAPHDFTNVLSFDLRWFSPSDAKRVLALATERGLLVAEGALVRPSFAADAVEMPVNFRPGPETLDEPAAATVPPAAPARPWQLLPGDPEPEDGLLARAADAAGLAPEALRREAEHEREKSAGLLTLEAAAVLVLARRGHDVAVLAREARAGL